MLDKLRIEDWQAHLDEVFNTLPSTGEAIELRLLSVAPLGAEQWDRRQPYSLEFGGPLQPLLPQATYNLFNREMGELGIFLVPLGPRGGMMVYEAIFT